MCLKERINAKEEFTEETIIKKNHEMIRILEETKQARMCFLYELVRQLGYYNMLDERARELTGLPPEQYHYIRRNYDKLMKKNSLIKEEVQLSVGCIKATNFKKAVNLKGCKNCIDKVTNKLDVTINDLCDKCRKEVENYMSHKE